MVIPYMDIASVKHSCESNLESFVSKYENHFDVRRNVNEDTANEEFEMDVKGPNLAQSNSRKALAFSQDLYGTFSKPQWNVKCSETPKLYSRPSSYYALSFFHSCLLFLFIFFSILRKVK